MLKWLNGERLSPIATLLAIVVISVTGVIALMTGSSEANVIGFLAPTVVALLTLLKVESTQQTIEHVSKATDIVERKIDGELDGRIRENVILAIDERKERIINGKEETP